VLNSLDSAAWLRYSRDWHSGFRLLNSMGGAGPAAESDNPTSHSPADHITARGAINTVPASPQGSLTRTDQE
jgi:hypothetical protein